MNKINNIIKDFSSKLKVPRKLFGKYFDKSNLTIFLLFTIKSSKGRRIAIPMVSKIPNIKTKKNKNTKVTFSLEFNISLILNNI